MAAVPLKTLQTQVAAGPPYDPRFMELLATDSRAGAQKLLATAQRKIDQLAAARQRLITMLEFERGGAAQGFKAIAGVDEAGRGPLAGPVVAGAVILHPGVLADPQSLDPVLHNLNDSKQLKESQRETLFEALMQSPHAYGVGIVEAHEIDHLGIQQANFSAMHRAIGALPSPPDYLLIDGYTLPGTTQPALRIIKGDARALSIAAASIIAKVTRDRIMKDMDRRYPQYDFAKHKGYGTATHIAAIEEHGPCPIHRKTFAPIAQYTKQNELNL